MGAALTTSTSTKYARMYYVCRVVAPEAVGEEIWLRKVVYQCGKKSESECSIALGRELFGSHAE